MNKKSIPVTFYMPIDMYMRMHTYIDKHDMGLSEFCRQGVLNRLGDAVVTDIEPEDTGKVVNSNGDDINL